MAIIWIHDQIIIVWDKFILFQVIKSDAVLNLFMYIYLLSDNFFPDYFISIVFVEHHQGKKNIIHFQFRPINKFKKVTVKRE